MRISRAVVATVAQQDDFMKRVRENGGARTWLQPEGIIILGQYSSHCVIAEALEISSPDDSEFVSIKVVPADKPGKGVAEIDGGLWKIAKPDDPVCKAPLLPKI